MSAGLPAGLPAGGRAVVPPAGVGACSVATLARTAVVVLRLPSTRTE